MNTQNFISPDQKKEFESMLVDLDKYYIHIICGVVNDWFKMSYPDIYKKNKSKREYCRLYTQHLWRFAADREYQDFSSAITKLVQLVEQTEKRKSEAIGRAIAILDKVYQVPLNSTKSGSLTAN